MALPQQGGQSRAGSSKAPHERATHSTQLVRLRARLLLYGRDRDDIGTSGKKPHHPPHRRDSQSRLRPITDALADRVAEGTEDESTRRNQTVREVPGQLHEGRPKENNPGSLADRSPLPLPPRAGGISGLPNCQPSSDQQNFS